MGHSVSLPAGRTPAKGASISVNTRTPLRDGCAGERIGTRYFCPGGNSPLKRASLIMGDV